jgi:hypothetical protein
MGDGEGERKKIGLIWISPIDSTVDTKRREGKFKL